MKTKQLFVSDEEALRRLDKRHDPMWEWKQRQQLTPDQLQLLEFSPTHTFFKALLITIPIAITLALPLSMLWTNIDTRFIPPILGVILALIFVSRKDDQKAKLEERITAGHVASFAYLNQEMWKSLFRGKPSDGLQASSEIWNGQWQISSYRFNIKAQIEYAENGATLVELRPESIFFPVYFFLQNGVLRAIRISIPLLGKITRVNQLHPDDERLCQEFVRCLPKERFLTPPAPEPTKNRESAHFRDAAN